MMATHVLRYSGRLYYHGSNNEYVDICNLIVRDGEIAFGMVSVIAAGRWHAIGGVTAKLLPEGFYFSTVSLSNGNVSESWNIRLRVECDDSAVSISGQIFSASEIYKFSGELELSEG